MVVSELICYFNPFTMYTIKNIPVIKKPVKYPIDLSKIKSVEIPKFNAIDLMQLYRKTTNQLEDQLDIKMVMYDFTLLELLLTDLNKKHIPSSINTVNINKKIFLNSDPLFNIDELKFKDLLTDNEQLRYGLYLVKFGRIKTLIGFQIDATNKLMKNKKNISLLGISLIDKINYETFAKKYLQLKLMKIKTLKYGVQSNDSMIRFINSISINKIYHMLSLDKRHFYKIIKIIYNLCKPEINKHFTLKYNNNTFVKTNIEINNHKKYIN